MRRFSAPLLALSLISTACFCGAFVSPIAKSKTSHATINSLQLGGCHHASHLIGVHLSKRRSTCIASKEKDEAEEDGVESTDMDEPPSMAEKIDEISLGIFDIFFNIFSFGIQFLGVFFSLGLLLNLMGFGYTVDLEHGLVIDRIQNIRNDVQFEREIEREERADLKGSASSKFITNLDVPENNVVSVGDQ
mmetsp:Transcript_15089/g.27309  ORF Transcript_15089/g.27309 Transcript_15089/m.27309 type:complete len:191 (+) Transcript_15089:129-701(+)